MFRLRAFETFQLLDQRGPFEVQQPRRLHLVALGFLEGAFDQVQFEPLDVALEIDPFVGEPRRPFDGGGKRLDLVAEVGDIDLLAAVAERKRTLDEGCDGRGFLVGVELDIGEPGVVVDDRVRVVVADPRLGASPFP